MKWCAYFALVAMFAVFAAVAAPAAGEKSVYVTVDPMDETTIYKAGMTREDLRALVAKYSAAGVRGLVWRVQHLGIAGYPTRLLTKIDEYPPKLPEPVYERCKDRKITATKIPPFRKMLENMDPLEEAVKACHEKGLELYFFVDIFDEMFSKFLLANTDCLVSTKDGAKYPGLRDYSNEKAVRQKLDAIAELYRYAPDGLYLCTSCHARHLKFPEPDMAFGTLPGAKFTDFLARLKAECRPHGIKLMVGTALGGSLDFSSPHFSEHVKYRIELEWKRWIDEGIADSLVLGDYECLWRMDGLWQAKGIKSVAPGRYPADVFIPEYVRYAKGRVPLLVFSGWLTVRQCRDQLRECADTVRNLGLDGILAHESMPLEGVPDSNAQLRRTKGRMHGRWVEREVCRGEAPSVSPDGRSIAFMRLDDHRYAVYVRSIQDGAERRASPPGFKAIDPRWRADGALAYSAGNETKSAYVARNDKTGWNIDASKDGRIEQLTSGRVRHTCPSFGPDGTLYFVSDVTDGADAASIQRREVSGGFSVCVPSAKPRAMFGDPSVSPDGRLLLRAEAYAYNRPWQIVVSPMGEKEKRTFLTGADMAAYAPAWSPDGRWIAFTGYREGDDGWHIYFMSADGSGMSRVAKGCNPAFAPDGTTLYYDRDGRIWTIDMGGDLH